MDELNFKLKALVYPELLCFSETWFHKDLTLEIQNYSHFVKSRTKKDSHGGVAIYVRNDFEASEINDLILIGHTSEQIWCTVPIGKVKLLIGCIYRPPTTSKYYSESINDEINRSIMRATQLVNEKKIRQPTDCW